ncbi:DNA polymerase iota isoform X4 [Capricornis sumatraensis]|uniref:DNA polymerase iota isoform X4 n=1 Tax=Capricornis sumatraensis TaxID=34865 RepID=UPI0036048F2A
MEKRGVEPQEAGGGDDEEADSTRAMERAEAGAPGGWPGALEPDELDDLPWFHDELEPAGSSSCRVIVHVDLDCFYAQVEMISNPELKDKPLGVQQKYLVVTCNYEARKLGVKKLMSVRDAKEKCPQLVLVNGEDLTRYREMSYKVTGIGYKMAKRLEALGISSVRDLQTVSSKILEKELGISVAQRIQKLSFGEDDSPVTPSGPPQSFSEEDSFRCSSEVEAKTKIEELLASLLNRVCQDGRKPHTIRLVIRRYSSEKLCNRESRQCPIPSHIVQKLGAGNYDVMAPMVDILMKLFRNMVNVKMPFHLTLLSVCFCNLKSRNTAKKGTIDYYLTPSLSTTSHTGKRSFKMKDCHMEDFSKDKQTNRDFLSTGRIESTRTGESPPDPTNSSKEKDSNEFPLSLLPEDIDQEVFKQLPVDIQEEILSGKSREKVQGKGSLSCPLHASRGVLSFFSMKQKQDSSLNPKDHVPNSKQVSSVSPCEPGTSGGSSSSYVSSQKDYSHYLDSSLKDERMSQGPKESQGFHFSNTNPAVSVFHSFPNLQSEQLFSKNRMTDSHKQPVATVSRHEGLKENREQESPDEKIAFPSDIDPEVFYELPEEVQKELLADWKRTGSDFHTVHK